MSEIEWLCFMMFMIYTIGLIMTLVYIIDRLLEKRA
jgi:flagellar biogenesis protein FliO